MAEKNDQVYGWQLTDAELDLLSESGLPGDLKGYLKEHGQQLGVATRAAKKVSQHLRATHEMKKLYNDILDEDRRREQLLGELVDRQKLQREVFAAKEKARELEQTLASERQKRLAQTAEPAMSVNAKGAR